MAYVGEFSPMCVFLFVWITYKPKGDNCSNSETKLSFWASRGRKPNRVAMVIRGLYCWGLGVGCGVFGP